MKAIKFLLGDGEGFRKSSQTRIYSTEVFKGRQEVVILRRTKGTQTRYTVVRKV